MPESIHLPELENLNCFITYCLMVNNISVEFKDQIYQKE